MLKKKPQKISVGAFMNSYTHGKSGGDMVFLEIAKRIFSRDSSVMTSSLGADLIDYCGFETKKVITTEEKEFGNIYVMYFLRIFLGLIKLAKFKNYKILISSSDFLPDVLPAFLLKLFNGKVFWLQHIFHLIPEERAIPHIFQKLSFLLIQKRADIIVVDNKILFNELVVKGFDSKKIRVNYPAIDHNKFQGYKVAEKQYEGVIVAQLRESKGVIELLDIWKKVTEKIPDAKLNIIGKGTADMVGRIKSKIHDLRLTNTAIVRGYLPDSEAYELVSSSKVFLFPSHEEGFGIVGVEAQALGLPVVAWNLPIFDEIFPKGMIKCALGNIDDFSNSVIKLLVDEKAYITKSNDSLRNSKRFDWDNTAQIEKEIILKEKKWA